MTIVFLELEPKNTKKCNISPKFKVFFLLYKTLNDLILLASKENYFLKFVIFVAAILFYPSRYSK